MNTETKPIIQLIKIATFLKVGTTEENLNILQKIEILHVTISELSAIKLQINVLIKDKRSLNHPSQLLVQRRNKKHTISEILIMQELCIRTFEISPLIAIKYTYIKSRRN